MADYIPIRAVRPHGRKFFEDGVVFDLYPEPDRMAAELEKLGPGLRAPFEAFLNYCGRQYDLVNRGYFEE
jgi:phytoene dehydrogenase-like protein